MKEYTEQGFPQELRTVQLPGGRYMRIIDDFVYVDSDKKVHSAPSGYEYNGGNVPRWLWPLIGSPFTGKARRGFPIHDVECGKAHKAPTLQERWAMREAADKTLLDVCKYEGVSLWRRRLIYRGIRLGACTVLFQEVPNPPPTLSAPPIPCNAAQPHHAKDEAHPAEETPAE
jgi:hypothetical protein